MMTVAPAAERASIDFAADVRRGLQSTPKTLPAQYFYDDLGSQLFEAICQLPWYPITRAERRLLESSAAAMVAPLGELTDIIELGSGSGEKIALLAQALETPHTQSRPARLGIHLIDISDKALELSRSALARLPHVDVVCHGATYEDGLRAVARGMNEGRGRRLVLFLGSNIGNFDARSACSMMAEIRRALRPGDGLLLGVDLVRSEEELILAYDDPLGVTAAFNKNILLRMNTELGADFQLDAFCHRARWDPKASRVEMHLVSRRPQRARIPKAGIEVRFDEGETIWTESSYKYTPDAIIEMGRRADLRCHEQWIDPASFSTTLFIAGLEK